MPERRPAAAPDRQPPPFGPAEVPPCPYPACRVAVLPVPFERTTSYGHGTAAGPAAILAASGQLETWDEEVRLEPHRLGIHTLPSFDDGPLAPAAALAALEATAAPHFAAGRFLLSLGGEHSLTAALVRAARAAHADLAVVQFDAHADLRDVWDGTPLSHACVMRRLVDSGVPTLALGVRALSPEEDALIASRRLRVVWGHELASLDAVRLRALLAPLPERVYLTFDLDFLDPSVLPATGTPVPGGGAWHPTLALLRALFAAKRVVGMDVVELAPRPGEPRSDFAAALLAWKCLAYLASGGGEPAPGSR